ILPYRRRPQPADRAPIIPGDGCGGPRTARRPTQRCGRVSVCAVLYLDPAAAAASYRQLADEAKPLRVRYAVKANPHPALLGSLADAGAHFAVTSLAALDALAALGVDGARIASVTPGPPASLLRRCQAIGVRTLTVDNPWELRKAAALVPGAAVSV